MHTWAWTNSKERQRGEVQREAAQGWKEQQALAQVQAHMQAQVQAHMQAHMQAHEVEVEVEVAQGWTVRESDSARRS